MFIEIIKKEVKIMILLEVLEKVYKRKKDGSLSYHALKFCEKHNLSLDDDNPSLDKLLVAFSMLSNKEKRAIAIKMIYKEIEKQQSVNNNVAKNTELLEIRNISYKKACAKYHPDNKVTGDEGIFKFLQDVKMAFWDYKGIPRKEISYFKWEDEREIDEKGVNYFF